MHSFKKETQSQDLGLIVNICKAHGLVQTSARMSTLEPHRDIQISHTNSEALNPSRRASQRSCTCPQKDPALPTITRL